MRLKVFQVSLQHRVWLIAKETNNTATVTGILQLDFGSGQEFQSEAWAGGHQYPHQRWLEISQGLVGHSHLGKKKEGKIDEG